jgi:hypothetical protein
VGGRPRPLEGCSASKEEEEEEGGGTSMSKSAWLLPPPACISGGWEHSVGINALLVHNPDLTTINVINAVNVN